METQIFYWTGVIIWWMACTVLLAIAGTAVVIAPVAAYTRFRLSWWTWRTAAKFMDLGWTAEEINHAARRVGGLDDQFLRKAQRLMDAGAEIREGSKGQEGPGWDYPH